MYDSEKLVHQMGQFEVWCDKLFVYRGEYLGWQYMKWVGP